MVQLRFLACDPGARVLALRERVRERHRELNPDGVRAEIVRDEAIVRLGSRPGEITHEAVPALDAMRARHRRREPSLVEAGDRYRLRGAAQPVDAVRADQVQRGKQGIARYLLVQLLSDDAARRREDLRPLGERDGERAVDVRRHLFRLCGLRGLQRPWYESAGRPVVDEL